MLVVCEGRIATDIARERWLSWWVKETSNMPRGTHIFMHSVCQRVQDIELHTLVWLNIGDSNGFQSDIVGGIRIQCT